MQVDSRLWVLEVLGQALTQAAQHDEGTPVGEAVDPGSSAAACDTLLGRLRKGLRTEQQQYSGHSSPGSYSKRGGPPMDVFSLLSVRALTIPAGCGRPAAEPWLRACLPACMDGC